MSRELVPAGRRALRRDHIAFYRAVLDGIDLAAAWERYLRDEGDFTPAFGKATLEWVRQALIQEALNIGEPGLVGLLRREPWRVKTTSKPTLDEFRERIGDAGDWAEAELLEMWKEEYGAPDKAEARRDRLSERLRKALGLIENSQRRAPVGNDKVAVWLAPHLVPHLIAAGLNTIQDVCDALAARSTLRWEAVPGVGEVWADRIAAWLSENNIEPTASPSPSSPSPALSFLPVSAPGGQLVPAARTALASPAFVLVEGADRAFAVSPYLNGGKANSAGATDDITAIAAWLAAKATNKNTERAYRKAAERFMHWCHHEREIQLYEVKLPDCVHYREWLKALGRKTPEEWVAAGWRLPAEAWIGPRRPRNTGEWRPFEGPLSHDAIAYDLVTLQGLYKFLVETEVARLNPWGVMGKGDRKKLSSPVQQFKGRSFTIEQWKLVIEGLDVQGLELERRLLLVLWLGVACGLRASEMLSLTLGSIVLEQEPWRLRVIGKGNKLRMVPLPSPARHVLLSYLDSVGTPYDDVVAGATGPEDSVKAKLPILRARYGRRPKDTGVKVLVESPLHYTQLYNTLKKHLKARADTLAASDPIAAAKLRKASTHWLRHTCATLALKNDVKLPAVQKLLGHADLNTTTIYVTEHDDALASAMESFADKAL